MCKEGTFVYLYRGKVISKKVTYALQVDSTVITFFILNTNFCEVVRIKINFFSNFQVKYSTGIAKVIKCIFFFQSSSFLKRIEI